MPLNNRALYLRNIIFGIEDSLVSTVGLLSGIAASAATTHTILLTGVIYIIVEAFSMAIGSFLSEESAEEYESGVRASNKMPAIGAILMFISFVIAGFVPVAPYLFFAGPIALGVSVVLSIVLLFVLGFVSGSISHVPRGTRAFRMALLGGAAIILGIAVSAIFGIA